LVEKGPNRGKWFPRGAESRERKEKSKREEKKRPEREDSSTKHKPPEGE